MANAKPGSVHLRVLAEIGPLIVFFLVNLLVGGSEMTKVIAATTAFMVAVLVAALGSLWKSGRISPMLWLSAILVLIFGGLTLWFRDETFIKIKPTALYLILAAALGFGLLSGRLFIQGMLETAYPGLSEKGWRKLTRNWMLFFVAMAVANEAVWRTQSWDFWVNYKLWAAVPLTMAFGFSNLPMLRRHGARAKPGVPSAEG